MDMPDFVKMVKEKLESEVEDVDNAMLPLEGTVFDDDNDVVRYAVPSDSKAYDDTGVYKY